MKDKTRRATVAKVSDHALIRYLERGKGFDFSVVKEKLRKAAQIMLDSGASTVIVDGVELAIAPNGTVTTVFSRAPRYDQKRASKTVVHVD
jgi:hypothetical protein